MKNSKFLLLIITITLLTALIGCEKEEESAIYTNNNVELKSSGGGGGYYSGIHITPIYDTQGNFQGCNFPLEGGCLVVIIYEPRDKQQIIDLADIVEDEDDTQIRNYMAANYDNLLSFFHPERLENVIDGYEFISTVKNSGKISFIFVDERNVPQKDAFIYAKEFEIDK